MSISTTDKHRNCALGTDTDSRNRGFATRLYMKLVRCASVIILYCFNILWF